MSSNDNQTIDWSYVDPMEPGEWAALGVGFSVLLIVFAFHLYALWHRNYLPIKAKQLDLMMGLFFAGFIWYFGALTSLRVLPQAGHPAFLQCSFWGVWVQFVLGAFVWTSILAYRFWRLFAIVKLSMDASTWLFRLSILFFWAPTLLYGIIYTVFKVDGPTGVDGIYECYFKSLESTVTMVIFGIYLVIFVILIFLLRNIKQRYLQEYRESIIVTVILVVCFVIYSVMNKLELHLFVWGRAICSILILIISCSPFVVYLSYPLYQCHFNYNAYLDTFKGYLNGVSVSSDKRNPQSSQNQGHEHENKETPSEVLADFANSLPKQITLQVLDTSDF